MAGLTTIDALEPSGSNSSTGSLRSDFTRQSSAAPVAAAACSGLGLAGPAMSFRPPWLDVADNTCLS